MTSAPAAIEADSTTREFRAMNTDWWVTARGAVDLEPIEALVHDAEARFSRFRDDSALARLNRERCLEDRELAAMATHAAELTRLTRGAFDIRVGAAIEAAGYDRSFELLATRRVLPRRVAGQPSSLTVVLEGNAVQLEGEGALDLGGIAKGWTIDRAAEALEAAGIRDYVIDGGGDIRAGGDAPGGDAWGIGVGDGLAVRLEDRAVCTSSTRRRRWRMAEGEAHHIIDPASGAPATEAADTAVVIATDAATADALATALLADLDRGLAAVVALGAEALFGLEGRWEMTPGMERWLI
ncbi:MAG: FAD:protein FMN transferase [Dehalococcoidia bacterium]